MGDPDARLREQVLAGRREGTAMAAQAQLEKGATAASVVGDVLVPAMREARQRYVARVTVLPAVLGSAEVARLALEHLGDQPDARRGSVVVATLEGDVHHIGKALLVSLLEASGYTVFDLGSQVSIQTIADAAMLLRPDAIGLSALLVSTSQQMPACVQELDRRGMRVPVLVGGASINRAFGRRVGILPDGRIYEPGVFYCRDVFEGLEVLDELGNPDTGPARIARNRAEAEAERDRAREPAASPRPWRGVDSTARSAGEGWSVPSPPYWGGRRPEPALDDVWRHLDLNTLYRHHWGGFHAKGADYERLVREVFEPLLEELKQDALRDNWLEARIVMGYFPCEAEDDHLLVYHPTRPERVVRQLDFPRQAGGEGLCLTDYFRSADSGERDVLVLQAVSAGSRAGAYVDELQRAGEYRRMLFVNGLASATAEALAEYALQVARRELGLEPGRGLRFSWGYPACPDLLEQHKILSLLGSAAEIDLTLSESGNLEPEHSTAAMVVHHPAAKYFSI